MENDLHARDRVGVQDFVLLEDYTSEKAFIDNLHKRFKEDLIYTYIGSVLISVNPYKNLPIYGADYVEQHRNVHFYEVPPHVFSLTDTAIRSMRGENRDQCILISGESGAGKTEASKKVLQFIAATARQKAHVTTVKDKLLQSNPVLEAFGNAKTNRNDNSSRFGKYMDVEFDYLGDPIGGHILNYLLEKSRVVYQSKGERNFHIFYQLLAGAQDEFLKELSLTRNPKEYAYLNQGDSCHVDQVDDNLDYKSVTQALQIMEVSCEEQSAMMYLVAIVIHLGNLRFVSDGGKTEIANLELVDTIANLLGASSDAVAKALLNRTIDARGDVVVTPLTREGASHARDALAKAIYERLFNWLVKRLNKSLQAERDCKKVVIGILDIYGFEIFQKNSFEQLNINYCNEKLQQLFIELTLRSEQEEYLREGIEWEPITYFDNKIICDLVEEKHKGIISILDEECLRPGDASDLTFLSKMNQLLHQHPHYLSHAKGDTKIKKTIDRNEFRLLHYAGEVTYSVEGFLDKNNDLLYRDLKEVMTSSSNRITKDVFTLAELNNKKRPETTSSQFKSSLAELVEILTSKEPSYIRCIKPNERKQAVRFDNDIVSHQIKYLGLMENLRVRRAGFAYRRPYEPFLNRYKSLCPDTWPMPTGSPKSAVQTLVNHLKFGHDDYRMGHTKIFIRLPRTLFETEDALQVRKHQLATLIQKVYKGLIQRRKFLHMRKMAIRVQAMIRRFLAERAAKRRRWAVTTVRQFIRGFMHRNESINDANAKFITFVRCQYLLRLSKQHPKSVLDKTWPAAPASCQEASQLLCHLNMTFMARRYCKSISPTRRQQFELKVLAESQFKGVKKSYPNSIGQWFVDSRLSIEQQLTFATQFIESNHKQPGEKIIYTVPVTKFDRHGYKPRDRYLVLTNASVYVLDAKDCKVKHCLSFNTISGVSITQGNDNLILVRIPEDSKKDKGDLILECHFLIECLTWMIHATGNNKIVHIEETPCLNHNMVGGKLGKIEFTQGVGNPGFAKGKDGQLIVTV